MAKYVDEGHEVLVVSCTGGERGDVLNPKLKDDAAHPARPRPGAPRRDGRGPGDPRRAAHLARLRRLRPARGRPAAPAAGGLLRPRAARRHDRGAGPRDPAVPPARRHDVRRERRLPPPRPHHVPRRVDGGRRGGRRPGGVPARRASLAAAEDLLQPDLQPGPDRGVPRGADRAGRGEPLRRVAGELVAPRPRRDHPRGVRGLVRERAMPRCSRTPPRSTPTARGSGCRARCRPGSGRPRTSRRPCPSSRSSRGRTTCSPASPRDVAAADALATSGDLAVVHDTRTERDA